MLRLREVARVLCVTGPLDPCGGEAEVSRAREGRGLFMLALANVRDTPSTIGTPLSDAYGTTLYL